MHRVLWKQRRDLQQILKGHQGFLKEDISEQSLKGEVVKRKS